MLGTGDQVRGKISACLPGVNWSDPIWGIYDGDGFSYEFNLNIGRNEPCDGFMVHVRGSGDAVSLLLRLSERCGWYLLDTSQGEWLHHCSDTEEGWHRFQVYRDRMLGRTESQADGSA
jgi:hypothetical protein